jgi:altronate hydrolase
MKFLKINNADNVAVALEDLQGGQSFMIDDRDIVLSTDIPRGHKFALTDFAVNDNIIKYGYPIGHAVIAVNAGDLVNEKSIKTNLEGVLEYSYQPQNEMPDIPNLDLKFKGYKRSNGDVGIRNEIWIIPTVGCVNGTINDLAEKLRLETGMKGVDAIIAYPHNYGCSQLGDDHENTRKVLRNMVLHPNAGGVLVVGLGCENNQVTAFKEMLGDFDESRIKFMETQKVDDEVETGMQLLREIYEVVSQDKRELVPLSKLKVGLKCGGSDGLSGITANPLLGLFSDFLVAQGGTTVLTEVPEMFGAETILMNRVRKSIAGK